MLPLALWDGYPVTEHHVLVLLKRHVSDYFTLHGAELNACNQLVSQLGSRISEEDQTVSGFNVGVNSGEVAGQTILHAHIHLILRRDGDVEDPRRGISNVIPGKGDY